MIYVTSYLECSNDLVNSAGGDSGTGYCNFLTKKKCIQIHTFIDHVSFIHHMNGIVSTTSYLINE